jgi:hypothetical protein
MKPIVVIALLACCATPALAQTERVTLKDGATWIITAEHTRTGDIGQTPNWGLVTAKRLTWHAGGKGRMDTLTVTPISSKALPGSPVEVATARSLAIPATLEVDEGLTPGPLLHPEAARAEVAKLTPSAANGPSEVLDAAAKAMIASELMMTSHGQGLPLKMGKTISADAEMPNPFGGPPMRAIESATLDSLDSKAGRAAVTWRQVLDPAALKASTEAMLLSMVKGKVSPEKIEEVRAAFAGASVQNETTCRHEIALPSGLAIKSECDMSMVATLQGKTQHVAEHWTITQTLPE